MAIRRYRDGILVEEWDADTGLYRRFNTLGYPMKKRPLTAAELAQVQDYDRAVAEAGAVDQAQQTVDGIQAQTPTFSQQLQADITAVQGGWDALTADDRTQIMLRVLNGFATVMDGLQAHAAVTGAIDPLAAQEAP